MLTTEEGVIKVFMNRIEQDFISARDVMNSKRSELSDMVFLYDSRLFLYPNNEAHIGLQRGCYRCFGDFSVELSK